MSISIIIPTLNEATTVRDLAVSLAGLRGDFEIIVADGGSQDATVTLLRQHGLRVIETVCGRGVQMNAAARLATGDVLLFLHADTRLPEGALAMIENLLQDERIYSGNFSLVFDGDSREARLLTWLYPLLRLGGMCYGDSAIFVRRSVFERLGGYREYPIFEDCDLYRRVRKVGKFIRLRASAVTSSRRFKGRFVRTFALWATMQVLYWLGVDPHRLDRWYKPLR